MKTICLLISAVLISPLAEPRAARPFNDFLLRLLDVQPGMAVADVGAGRGDLAFLLAEAVGPGGRVYANEISREKVRSIEDGRQERSLSNLTTILGGETDPLLPAQVDCLVMVQVFHHLSAPDSFMASTRKYLKPDGRLVVTAVLNKRNPRARPVRSADACVSDPEETRKAIEKAGYVFEKLALFDDPNPEAGWPTSYVLIFRASQISHTAGPLSANRRPPGRLFRN